MSRYVSRLTIITVLLALVAAGWWGLRWFLAQDPGGSNGYSFFGGGKNLWIERVGPDGTRYTVDAAPAIYRLEMLPEDAHSRRVFTSYGAALRYAREHDLPGMPSASLVLATCSASDFRLQAALEMTLDADPKVGRRLLLEKWLKAVLAGRRQAPQAGLAAYDGAATYLAGAMVIGGADPQLPVELKRLAADAHAAANDPPLGPWASTPQLGAIWKRDRFLSRGVPVTDAASAAVAAVLARTMTADGALAAGWNTQVAVSRVLHGKESGPTFELLGERLAGVPDAEVAGDVSVEIVRATVASSASAGGRSNPAPAALALVMTPEEEVLEPLQMKAWNDPIGDLVRAIRAGEISLDPGPDAGFYRQRWFALETLAAPGKAPEFHKLQLSADYQRRWQRMFAAGFTEGRSGLLKRMPILTLGSKVAGEIAVDIAPQFSAEPAPAVYLRLARAYRNLERNLATAIGAEQWRQLSDAAGHSVATDLRQRAEVLYGLAVSVYREVGFSPPLQEEETAMDMVAAKAAADAWRAALESNPDVNLDARLLVTLASDGTGSHRCPAVLGVRLEPVEYTWAEEPDVSGNMNPRFVPARYWLASPLPATVTVGDIPTPAEFRKRCDGHSSVRELYAAFGERPPPLQSPQRSWRWWPWFASGVALLGLWFVITRWWRQRTRRCRKFIKAGLAVGSAVALAIAVFAPPLWLLRLAAVRCATAHKNIMLVAEYWIHGWAGEKMVALVIDLLGDSDPQVNYFGAMLLLNNSYSSDSLKAAEPVFGTTQVALLRSRIHDEVFEVGCAAWAILCLREDQVPFLISELERCAALDDLGFRLNWLEDAYPSRPDVVGVALKLAADPRPSIRAAVLPYLVVWKKPVPALVDAVRTATHDVDPVVRAKAVAVLGRLRAPVDLDRLLAMWNDPVARVRSAAFKAVGEHIGGNPSYHRASDPGPRWTDESVQRSLVQYARNDAVTLDERLDAARWIADPATLRASCRELLPAAKGLPEHVVYDGTRRQTRSRALALLATRWVLADHYAQLTGKDNSENSYPLATHAGLLDKLTNCIAENRSAESTLELLREELKQPENRAAVASLIHRLEQSSKTPVGQ